MVSTSQPGVEKSFGLNVEARMIINDLCFQACHLQVAALLLLEDGISLFDYACTSSEFICYIISLSQVDPPLACYGPNQPQEMNVDSFPFCEVLDEKRGVLLYWRHDNLPGATSDKHDDAIRGKLHEQEEAGGRRRSRYKHNRISSHNTCWRLSLHVCAYILTTKLNSLLSLPLSPFHSLLIDPGNATVTLGVVVNTLGYVAIGLSSQHASMVGMDMALLTKDEVSATER